MFPPTRMFFNFLQQLFYSGFLFLGISGVGLLLLRPFKVDFRNSFLTAGVAYFLSLCFFTLVAVILLFILPNKILTLRIFLFAYVVISFILWVVSLRRGWLEVSSGTFLREGKVNMKWIAGFMLAVFSFFLFFLQAYHTSILDEWLHRPVVKSFIENGIFPFVNPFDPTSNFIKTYHYGTQVVASAWELITGLGISESLDLVKFGTFIGLFVLLYGLILRWTEKRTWALLGAVAVIFCGSSFFFLDSFTASHLWRLKGLDQTWPINAPLSYMLLAITGVGTPATIAFILLIEDVFYRGKNFGTSAMVFFGVLLVGFFILTELFAFIIAGCFGLVILWSVVRGHMSWKQILRIVALSMVTFSGILYGVYATGGVAGELIEKNFLSLKTESFQDSISEVDSDARILEQKPIFTEGDKTQSSDHLLSFRSPMNWGFPSEKRILTVLDNPFFYLRSVLLELVILSFLFFFLIRRKEDVSQHPFFWVLAFSSLTVPFFLSSSMGDLNLAKTTALGFLLVHLIFLYTLSKIRVPRLFVVAVIVLLIFGVVPGMLMGPNIQWQWLSNKGKSIYCSQNPLCYKKKDLTMLLEKFETDYTGLKRVMVIGDDSRKVVDLSNSYVYTYLESYDQDTIERLKIGYIIDSMKLRERLPLDTRQRLQEYTVIMSEGEYSILKVN